MSFFAGISEVEDKDREVAARLTPAERAVVERFVASLCVHDHHAGEGIEGAVSGQGHHSAH